MVETVANTFLETLRHLLVEETKFLRSVSGNVEQVKRDLRSMHALLMKADRERRDSPTLKDYVAQLRDLAFKAETMLEAYAVKVESKKDGLRSLKEKLRRYICIMSGCYRVHQIGRDTQDIISRLANLTTKLESEFGRESSSHTSDQEDLFRQTYGHEIEHHFVGMKKDIEILVSMVKDETRSQRVVKIYGMGGIGKTTLARKIYNHADLQSYARAWVCITQHFQPKTVFGNILKQLDSNAHTDSMDVNNLVKGIYNFLQLQRKCLIVIDDIWENDHWQIIKPAFPKNCHVLLTTRSENIANQECDRPYKLECLTEDEGWELLQKIALTQNFGPVESLEDTGRRIVQKCGRLPLAISVIGGILRQKEHTSAEWEKVNVNMDSYLTHGVGVTPDKRIKQVLDLSYDALPYYLKPCFLYLACFAEDEGIYTERLYLLWMAEGFISYQDKGRNETLRDVAQRYLTELAMRCMVQVHKSDDCSPRDKFDFCRLHDLMHELCSSKAEEENLIKRIAISRYHNDIHSSIVNSISRLAIIMDTNGTISTNRLGELKDLRSLMLLGSLMFLGENGVIFSDRIRLKDGTINFERLQCLRILVLEGCDFEGDKLPSKVGKLIHLRYLRLNLSRLRELPRFVCDMPYLQSLDLESLDGIRLPNLIWKMKRLKHLSLPELIEVTGGAKLRLDGLDELETLRCIDSETARIADIPKLISLWKLWVTVGDMDSMTTVVNHMNRLCHTVTCLGVKSCDLSSENGRDVFKNVLMSPSLDSLSVWRCDISGGFPYYEQGMCENFVELDIIDCKVGGDVMEELGKYPMLQKLLLRGEESEMTETLICRSNSFPQLKFLTLVSLPNLKKWEVEEKAMPKLTELIIYSCTNLEKVPDGLRFISTLRLLHFLGMSKEFEDYAKRMRE